METWNWGPCRTWSCRWWEGRWCWCTYSPLWIVAGVTPDIHSWLSTGMCYWSMSRSLNTSTYLIEDSSKFWSDTNIIEDDSIVVGDHIASTGGLEAEQGTGEGEGDQKRSVHHRGGQGLVDVVPVASHDHLQLLHLGFNVVPLASEPLEHLSGLHVSSWPHQPYGRFWHPPANHQEYHTWEGECNSVEINRNH